MGLFSKKPPPDLGSAFVGIAQQMQIPLADARRVSRALPNDAVNMNYTATVDGVKASATVEISMKLTDPHKLLGEDPTMFDVLSLLISQCVAARLE